MSLVKSVLAFETYLPVCLTGEASLEYSLGLGKHLLLAQGPGTSDLLQHGRRHLKQRVCF